LLRLEGFDIRADNGVLFGGPGTGTSVELVNCRIVSGEGAIVSIGGGGIVRTEKCILISQRGYRSFILGPRAEWSAEQCVLRGAQAVHLYDQGGQRLRFRRCTFDTPNLIGMTGKDPAEQPAEVDAESCAFHCSSIMEVYATDASAVRSHVRWVGRHNLFMGPDAPAVRFGPRLESAERGIERWSAFWPGREDASVSDETGQFPWNRDPARESSAERAEAWGLSGTLNVRGTEVRRDRFGAQSGDLPPPPAAATAPADKDGAKS
jgi:hypothetical protein